MQNATTPEQSRRLLACGVSADTADMCWSTRTRRHDGTFIAKKHQTTNLWIGYPCWRTTSGDEELENIPAWTLTSLLATLPPILYDRQGHSFNLTIKKDRLLHIHYKASYRPSCESQGLGDLAVAYDADPIEACVQLAERITAKGCKLCRPQKD